MNEELITLSKKLAELMPICSPEQSESILLAALNLAFALGSAHIVNLQVAGIEAGRIIEKVKA